VELLKVLRPLDLGPQDGLALDNAFALEIASVAKLFIGAAERILGGPQQGLALEDAVVGDRDVVGHRLEGAIGLEPGDVACQSRLLVPAQPAAEVEEQPLDVALNQIEGRLDVRADQHRSDAGYEGRKTPDLGRKTLRPKPESTPVEAEAGGGEEGRERDLLEPSGLIDVLELGTQPRLSAERHIDRLRDRQRLAAGGDGLERGLVGIAWKRRGGRRMVRIRPLWRLYDSGWYRTRSIALGAGLSSWTWLHGLGSIVLGAGLSSWTWLGGRGWPHVRVRRRSNSLAVISARRLTAGNFVRNDPPSERILKIGP